jgi:hypothetical protein
MMGSLEFWLRVQYVSFKRAVWMFETLAFLIVCVILLYAEFTATMSLLIFLVAALRVLTEALNHRAVAEASGVRDMYSLLYPFG